MILWLHTLVCCFWGDLPLRGVLYLTAEAVEETSWPATRTMGSGRRSKRHLLSGRLLNETKADGPPRLPAMSKVNRVGPTAEQKSLGPGRYHAWHFLHPIHATCLD